MRLPTLLAAFVFLVGMMSPALAQDASQQVQSAPQPSAAPQASGEFYKNGIQMSTTLCDNSGKYSCSSVTSDSEAIIDASNKCVTTYHGINERIMSEFKTSGEYENCVLPSKMYTDANGTNVWSICCIRRMQPGEECSLVCTRFISNKSSK